jgi:hypothetical protein
VELSDDAQKIMAESREEAAKIRAQLASLPTVPDNEPDEEMEMESATGRKIAKPKGKVGRFSDVHMQSFKKMDSIANHASAWRVNPVGPKNVPVPAAKALKRSPSKAELDKAMPPAAMLKRSPSKAELNKPVARTLQRSPSMPNLNSAEPSPFLTRSPSKLGLAARAAEERPMPSAKRVKHGKEDDAGTTRPDQVESPTSSATTTPRRQTNTLVRSKSGLLRPGFSSAMSPTKSSMARIQSVQNLKATTQIPALVRSNTNNNLHQTPASSLPRSKSMRDLNATTTPRSAIAAPSVHATAPSPSPTKIAFLPHTSPLKAPELAPTSSPMSTSTDTPKRIKSILRTPNRRYTRDPLKIAAGTHLSTPPSRSELYPSLPVPATEPITKRVDFTNSTKERAERDAFKAASVEPESVAYPDLPTLSSASRRTTMATVPTVPGAFTFRSDREIKFGSPKTTIRQVRTSDALLPPAFQFTGARAADSSSKRKLGTLDEDAASEKENHDVQEEEGHRPAKKARVASAGVESAPATPARKSVVGSKVPRFGSTVKRGGMSAARLSMLAKPKKRG